MIHYSLLIFMTLLGSIAALFLKKASVSKGIRETLKNSSLYIGGFLYVLAAFINIYLLRYLDYSTVLPLTSLTYVWTTGLSHFFLREKINTQKMIGTIGIVLGSIILVRS